ncbi:hypothetical protein [Kitasatospora sp. McL0602]|uniref:hypothetical protein n=1 Tax=Kitasatospora sp. McL0602 TaxID=3439530 RepID=UPI003F89BCEA
MHQEQGQREAPVTARALYEALADHTGPDAHAAVVTPWLQSARLDYRAALATAADRLCRPGPFDGPTAERQELVWELYALSRVNDTLLVAFQPPPESTGSTDGTDGGPWDALDHWPALTMDQYLSLFTELGMSPFATADGFDPFRHEIVDVEQAEDPDEPAQITEVVWPGLGLGPLLFSRSGARVRAGAHHAERGVADRSPLYWTFRRRHRPTVDLSLGWGHNSQWRTGFRLDHLVGEAQQIHPDGSVDLDDTARLDTAEALLTPAERRELLRHRCLLRTPVNAGALAAIPSWQADLCPFDWRLPGPE